MTGKIVCFASAKGGSGKTVICASVGSFLAGLGKKVLLIDMDAATNGLSLFYLEKVVGSRKQLTLDGGFSKGMFDAGPEGRPTPLKIDENMDLIPATFVMRQTEDTTEESFRQLAFHTVSFFIEKYDYVLLDAQSGSDRYAKIAIDLSHEIVIVSEFDPISLEGIDRLRHLFHESLAYNRSWVLFNKILPEFTRALDEMTVVARYLPPIPWDADVVRAFARRRLALNTKSGNTYTLAIMQTIYQLFGDEVKDEIDRWKAEREEAIRQPAREQLQEVEEVISLTQDRLLNVEFEAHDLGRRSRRIFSYYLAGALTFFSTLVSLIYSGSIVSVILLPVGLAAGASGVALLSYLQASQARWKARRRALEGERRALEAKIEDMRIQRANLRILSDSNLETLVRKSREQGSARFGESLIR